MEPEIPDRGDPVLAVVLDSPSKEFFPLGYVQATAGVCRPLWVLLRHDGETTHWARLLRRSGDVVDVADLSTLAAADAIAAFAPSGIVCFSEANVPWAAAVAHSLGLRSSSRRVAELLTDKVAQRAVLRDRGLQVPRAWDATTLRDDPDALREVEMDAAFPLLHRPRIGRGTTAELAAPASSAIGEVETGERVTVELLVRGGSAALLSVTGVHAAAGSISWGAFVPADIPAEVRGGVVAIAKQAAAALGVEEGPVQVEIALTEAGPLPVDANPWLGSTAMPVLLDHALGVDVFQVAMRAALGEDPVPAYLPWPTDVAFSICVTPPPERGGVSAADWIAALSTIGGIVEVMPRLVPEQTPVASVIQVSGIAPDHAARRVMEQRILSLIASPEAR